MARNEIPDAPRLWYMRYTQEFEAVDFSMPLQNPFDITNHVNVAQAEAQAKNCVVVVQVALVPFDKFYPSEEQEKQDNELETTGN